MRFLASSLIWWFLFLPVALSSIVVVPILCMTEWNGYTTWYGNMIWGRGKDHYEAHADTYLKQVWFLVARNPVSNFGKQVLSVKSADWVWLIDMHIIGKFYWLYGWKNETKERPGIRTFVYRPWFHD